MTTTGVECAATDYVAGREMEIKLVHPETGEDLLDDEGRPRYALVRRGDPVPGCPHWPNFNRMRKKGRIITYAELEPEFKPRHRPEIPEPASAETEDASEPDPELDAAKTEVAPRPHPRSRRRRSGKAS